MTSGAVGGSSGVPIIEWRGSDLVSRAEGADEDHRIAAGGVGVGHPALLSGDESAAADLLVRARGTQDGAGTGLGAAEGQYILRCTIHDDLFLLADEEE